MTNSSEANYPTDGERPVDQVPVVEADTSAVDRGDYAVSSEPEDPFEDRAPFAGLEELGRAIVDKDGQPSGSPANYEELRGASHPDGWTAQHAAPAVAEAESIIASIRAQLVDRELPTVDGEQAPADEA